MDDSEAIRRVIEGREEDAFRVLYARHTPAVYGFLCRLTGRAADAADLMQEAWLRAVRQLALFHGQSAFRTWLTGIALNCYREWRRRAIGHVSESGHEPRAPGIVPADGTVAVAETLDRLSDEHREVLVLHDIEGFTHDEIAAALGIEPGTSKSRLSRARRAFRDVWQGHHHA